MLAAFTLSAAALFAAAPASSGATTAVIAPQSAVTSEEAAILAEIDSHIAAIQSVANETAPSAACVEWGVNHFAAIRDIIDEKIWNDPEMIATIGPVRFDSYMGLGGTADMGTWNTDGNPDALREDLAAVKYFRAQLN